MDSNFPASQSSIGSDTGPTKFFVSSVELEFPKKPYKCQISTMNMILRGLRQMKNSLIESPTGSGKTLSLICSSLAWQRTEIAKLQKVLEHEAIEEASKRLFEEERRQQFLKHMQMGQEKQGEGEREGQMIRRRKEDNIGERAVVCLGEDEKDTEDFQMLQKKNTKKMKYEENTTDTATSPASSSAHHITSSESPEKAVQLTQQLTASTCSSSQCCEDNIFEPATQVVKETVASAMTWISAAPPETSLKDVIIQEALPILKARVAKIFYCSRTHQQLQQVIRELRKTAYKDVKMTILSSREHSCIQTPGKGISFRTKTELCHALLDPIRARGCVYKTNLDRMCTHDAIRHNCGLETPWDIEDLVQAGRKARACPYFASRELISESQIIFCPYIYLIDPKIRHTMELDHHMRGAVILLDEAHNIEDACREAASYSVLFDEIFQAVNDCRRVASLEVLPEVHNQVAYFLCNLMNWMSQKIAVAEDYRNDKEKTDASTWDGVNAVASFEEHNITLQNIGFFKKHVTEVITETNKEENKQQTKKNYDRYGIVPLTVNVLEGLSVVFSFMYDNNMEHIRTYYVVLSRSASLSSGSRKDLPDDVSYTNSTRSGLIVDADVPSRNWGYYLNFLCMNSGVVFKPIADMARSIALTSGTLSPLDTFSSELNVTFANELQALHIVDNTQVWAGALGSGPRGRELNASHRFTEMTDFRQELGGTILEVCKIIPFGVLCFLPSYSLLENLKQHWMRSGMWGEFETHKEVLYEIRGNRDFLSTIQEFYDSVTRCELGISKGPLLFAIFRGKVSEGLDFADNRARGVITVGIPYPYIFDTQVILKKKYNDANMKLGLKSGNQWYETQAYRALNQALGRCIRHKNDWGALIIIDKRFLTDRRHVEGLSKWIRTRMQPFYTFQQFHASLKSFVELHVPVLQAKEEEAFPTCETSPHMYKEVQSVHLN